MWTPKKSFILPANTFLLALAKFIHFLLVLPYLFQHQLNTFSISLLRFVYLLMSSGSQASRLLWGHIVQVVLWSAHEFGFSQYLLIFSLVAYTLCTFPPFLLASGHSTSFSNFTIHCQFLSCFLTAVTLIPLFLPLTTFSMQDEQAAPGLASFSKQLQYLDFNSD